MENIARTPSQIGEALRRERRRNGISQTTVGDKTKLRQATISALERGEADTQLSTLCDVLTALNLELVIRPRTAASVEDIEELF